MFMNSITFKKRNKNTILEFKNYIKSGITVNVRKSSKI